MSCCESLPLSTSSKLWRLQGAPAPHFPEVSGWISAYSPLLVCCNLKLILSCVYVTESLIQSICLLQMSSKTLLLLVDSAIWWKRYLKHHLKCLLLVSTKLLLTFNIYHLFQKGKNTTLHVCWNASFRWKCGRSHI